jgi:hypothetical protein
MVHLMDGVIVSWSPTSNALMVYNPCNRQYYKLDSYWVDSYPVTLTPNLTSTGYFGTPCMVYDVVLAIGTTKLIQSSGQSVLLHHWKIPASILGSFRILRTRRAPNPSLLFHWVYTLMTLCVSQKIRPSKLCFVAS